MFFTASGTKQIGVDLQEAVAHLVGPVLFAEVVQGFVASEGVALPVCRPHAIASEGRFLHGSSATLSRS